MSLSEQELEEQSEVELEEATLSDTPNSTENLDNMAILEQFTSDMVMDTTEMEIDDSLIVESHDVIEHEEEVIQIDDDIDPQEIEIQSDEQVVEEVIEKKYKPPPSVPPLRLLNIAPKPEQVPIVKSVSGQPVLLVPGSSSGQTIKLVNQQGQEISLGNYSLGRPISLKQSLKTQAVANSSMVNQQAAPKQIFMKKIITTSGGQKTVTKPVAYAKPGQQFVVVHKTSDQPQQIKLVPASNSNSSTTTKTITFQQAQEMGLLGNAKIIQSSVPQVPPKRTVLVNKAQPKTIKLMSQTGTAQVVNSVGNIKTIALSQVKAPPKILPASVSGISSVKGPQRIILKSSSGNQVLPAGQLIQVAGTQGLANGQIHQINVPGKGVQYIKFVTSTSAEQSSNSSVTVVNSLRASNTVLTSASGTTDVKPVVTTSKVVTKPINASGKPTQVMLVPAGYIPASVQQVPKIALPPVKPTVQPKQNASSSIPKQPQPSPSPETSSSPEPSENSPGTYDTQSAENQSSSANGIRPRKPCNCTKSQCLKLYCDCFANGEFCYLCNCVNCFNNLENEETRNMAIRACLERNPNAFRPKIGKAKDTTGDVLRKHTKGCNCKRSGCLKNYCECYEAKIACSNNCKCIGCRNVEDSLDRKKFSMASATQRMCSDELTQTVYRKILPYYKEMNTYSPIRHRKSNLLRKQPVTFITEEVIEATCQCLLTISDEADSNMQDEELTKRQIIEEFGGCLKEIINCSLTRSVS